MRIPRHERETTQDGWLALRRAGVKAAEIAREANQPLRTVQAGIDAARQREGSRPTTDTAPRRAPGLVIIFGASCKPLATLTCDDIHHGPIKHGSACCCGVCHQSGKDHYKVLQRDPRSDPKPEKKPGWAPKKRETRRERRARVVA